jgi:carboxyl-terminal processing protease
MKKILLLFICAITISSLAQKVTTLGEDSPLRKLAIAQMAISNLYVDSVDNKKLTEDAIRGMLEKLDPHSTYFTPKEVKSFLEKSTPFF